MPIYEYICNECQTKFDLLRPFSKADLEITCQNCESQNVRRLLSTCNTSNRLEKSNSTSSRCGSCQGGSCNGCHH